MPKSRVRLIAMTFPRFHLIRPPYSRPFLFKDKTASKIKSLWHVQYILNMNNVIIFITWFKWASNSNTEINKSVQQLWIEIETSCIETE